MKHIDMHSVTSSQIKAIGYSHHDKILRIQFHVKDAIYEYTNVPDSEYHALISASSPGKEFASRIKAHPHKFPFTKIA